ncbi:MAG TPA: hypothetical protein VLA52_01800, partial [Thermohalobaculum sp.]|nr:hypothetical protein [Thermohalobaculum sp.]
MRKSLVTRCCKAIGIAAALLYAAAVQDPARAGLFEDANVLVRGGDIDAIEQTFENQYQAFLRHEIDLSDQVRPYAAFYTLDPVVVEMVPAWRAAYPDSVHARVAQANLNQHLAVVLRGDEYNHMVPRRALDQARELWSEARSLGAEALDSAPSHAAAADALSASANWLGDNVAEQRGNKVLEAFASPRGTLLDQIADSLPQWGGSVAMMRHLCDARAPQVENLSVEECQARVTLLLSDTPAPERAAAVEVLR